MEKELDQELKELEITELNEKAENAVAVAVAATAATGAVPIPFADAPLLIGEQVALMATICGIYGIDVGKDGLKMLATTALSAGGAAIVGKTIATNLLKLIPGAGTVAGGVISAGTAGVVTLAMGKAFIEVCKSVKLGKLSESDITSSQGVLMMKEQFREQMKNSYKREKESFSEKSAKGQKSTCENFYDEVHNNSALQAFQKGLRNLSDENVLSYSISNIDTYLEFEVYDRELKRRGLKRTDNEYSCFRSAMGRDGEDEEREIYVNKREKATFSEEDAIEQESTYENYYDEIHNNSVLQAFEKGLRNLSDENVLSYNIRNIDTYLEFIVYDRELKRRGLKRTDNEYGHFRSAIKCQSRGMKKQSEG